MKFRFCFIIIGVLNIAQTQIIIPHQYLVSLKKGYAELYNPDKDKDYSIIKNVSAINKYGTILSLEFNDMMSEAAEIKWINQNKSIAYFQHNAFLQQRSCDPNDPYFKSQYDMALMKFNDAWCLKNDGLSPEGDTLVVAVVEFGLNYKDPDLLPNIFINHHEIPDNKIDDDNNGFKDDYYGFNADTNALDHSIDDHGTQVLSVVGAKGNNNLDISGTNQTIKMLICSSANTSDKLVSCYHYLIEMKRRYLNSGGKEGAFIVSTNLSSGIPNSFPSDFPLICQSFDSLGAVGILPSVATINDNADIDSVGDIPGTCPSDYLIVVTSTNRYDQKAEAGYGKNNVDIGACGEFIPMIKSNGNVDYASGTSFASPHVAGAVSVLYQYCKKLTELNKTDPPAAVKLLKKIILDSGDPLADLNGITTSGKRLNVINALQQLNAYCFDSIPPKEPFTVIIKNNLQNDPIQILLNPASFGDYKILVYNSLGQLIESKSIRYLPGGGNEYFVDIYGWPSGVYHFVVDGQGNRYTKSLIKI